MVKELIDWTKKGRTRLYLDNEHYVEGRVIIHTAWYVESDVNRYAFLTDSLERIYITRRGKNDRVRARGTRMKGDLAFAQEQSIVRLLDDLFEITKLIPYKELKGISALQTVR